MGNAIEFARALSALLWPFLGLLLFFTNKEDFRRLLRGIRKGRLLGQEIELEDSSRQLQEEATKAASEVKDIPKSNSAQEFGIPFGDAIYGRFWSTTENKEEEADKALSSIDRRSDPIDKIFEESARSPDLGVKKSYQHAPKRVTPGDSIETSSAVLKWYALHSEDKPVPDKIDRLARLNWRAKPRDLPLRAFQRR
jgi:hypothetical protein